MNTVYCTGCSCGIRYIRESVQNLKVRLNEHLHSSSSSTLSTHFLEHPNDSGHKPDLNNTTVLARESNTRKRKLVESMCIKFKPAPLCNAGVSLEMSGAWDLCTPALKKQLTDVDPDIDR